jgi:hypothetical protein
MHCALVQHGLDLGHALGIGRTVGHYITVDQIVLLQGSAQHQGMPGVSAQMNARVLKKRTTCFGMNLGMLIRSRLKP